MSGEDRFQFGDVQPDFLFQPSSLENLSVLSEEQVNCFNKTGYLTALSGLSTTEVADLSVYLVW